jgi:hypothetical protein
MSNLRLINETEISSSVASVDITDVFSADFDIYKITTDNMISASGTPALDLKYINSSGSAISSGYDRANLTLKGETTFAENRNTNASSVASGLSNAESNGAGSVSYVFNPFSSSSYTFHIMQGSFRTGSNYRSQKMISVLKNVASVTGLNITFNGANCTGGTIKVFGLRVDS